MGKSELKTDSLLEWLPADQQAAKPPKRPLEVLSFIPAPMLGSKGRQQVAGRLESSPRTAPRRSLPCCGHGDSEVLWELVTAFSFKGWPPSQQLRHHLSTCEKCPLSAPQEASCIGFSSRQTMLVVCQQLLCNK